jgi:hypothetical protein
VRMHVSFLRPGVVRGPGHLKDVSV